MFSARYLNSFSNGTAVRQKNSERHLQTEKEMTKYGFTFHHINYSRYLTYQQVYLRTLQSKRSKAVADLDEQSLGGSLSGLAFTSLHGNLITGIFNGQAKCQAGPHSHSSKVTMYIYQENKIST